MPAYIGEIRVFARATAPPGWAVCDGQLLAIAANEALFQLIGTTYGGDGQETFALPDLRQRMPIHRGGTFPSLGVAPGVESVTLTASQIPAHTHAFLAAQTPGNRIDPNDALPANSASVTTYTNQHPGTRMHWAALDPVGGSQPHHNQQPYVCLSFIISLYGIFPSPT